MSRSLIAAASGAAFVLTCLSPAIAHHPDLAIGGNGAGIVTVSAATLEEGHFSFSLVTQFAGFSNVDFAALKEGQHAHQMKNLISPSLSVSYD